jgi:hypothetical protein
MEHHRLRKYRGPETWARVKAAYVAGESAPSVARRFDVGLSNLRRRAMREGWTRNRIATRLDVGLVRGGRDDPFPASTVTPPPEEPLGVMVPVEALRLAVLKAAWLVGEGRGAEACALLKAMEALRAADERLDQGTRSPFF